jgi:DNA-binding response OmpR family regulator
MRVLLLDDDARLAEMLRSYLAARGVDADWAKDLATGRQALDRGGYDALLLDVMLPDGDGFEMLRRLRAGSEIPVLMLTARGEDTDRIVGLELGADDYLPKPFNPRELLARLHAILRRGARTGGGSPGPGTSGDAGATAAAAAGPGGPGAGTRAALPALRYGRLEIDPPSREVRVDGVPRRLTSHQFDLLLALARHPGRVLNREQLLELAGTDPGEVFDRAVDVHVSRIRSAIEDDPKNPRWLVTVRGTGYVFTPARGGSNE